MSLTGFYILYIQSSLYRKLLSLLADCFHSLLYQILSDEGDSTADYINEPYKGQSILQVALLTVDLQLLTLVLGKQMCTLHTLSLFLVIHSHCRSNRLPVQLMHFTYLGRVDENHKGNYHKNACTTCIILLSVYHIISMFFSC